MKKKMQSNKLVQIGLMVSVLLMSSTVFSYSVLWDISNAVPDSPYRPSGFYQTLVQHLGNLGDNSFTVDTTLVGFLVDDPADYDVIVVCATSASRYNPHDPDEYKYSFEEVQCIANFVAGGGGLLIMGDYKVIPNDNIQPVASEFGITGFSSLGTLELRTTELANHPIFSGVDDDEDDEESEVHEIFMYVAAELTASSPASPVAWKEGTGEIVAAVAEYGQGRVVALGDSSLWATDTNWDYFHEEDNPQFSVNTFEYLAIPEPATVLLLGLGSLILLRRRRI